MDRFSLDILRLIFSFGYAEHRRHVSVINEKIKDIDFSRQRLFEMIEDDVMQYCPQLHFSYQMFQIYPHHIKRKLFKLCVSCYCCDVHCSNRPRNIHYIENTPACSSIKNCTCPCRSYARLIHDSYVKPVLKNNYKSSSVIHYLF